MGEPNVKPAWNSFKLQLDENAGVYNLPRKTPAGEEDGWYFTNNAFLRLYYQPQATMKKDYGVLGDISLWLRTTDLKDETTKTMARFFAGPIAYYRPIENDTFRLQLNENPNIFWGHDLNSPEPKTFKCWEFGNYASIEALYKPLGLSLDFHNWVVAGLDVELAGGKKASELGWIVGDTLSWSPGLSTGISLFDSLAVYARYRHWNWKVEPEGMDVEPKGWNEFTAGFKADLPF